jgi:glycerol uptake facilitator-like aquaporin
MENGHGVWNDRSKRPQFQAALIYEFLGTGLVTAAYNLGRHNGNVRAGAYLGGFLFAASVSGGHFNPATTLAVYLTEKERRDQNRTYLIWAMVVQLMGAFIGTLIAFLALKDYVAGAKNDYSDYLTDSFSLFPVP